MGRFPTIGLAVLLSAVIGPALGSTSKLACYPSAASYMAATWGPDYKADENLKVSHRKFGSQTFTYVVDNTPTTNVVHILFRPVARKGLCMVLKSNPMISLEVTKQDKAGRPLVFVGSSQGQVSHEVMYTLQKSGTYEPTRCRYLTYSDRKTQVAEVVPCSKVLSDPN